MKALTLNAPLKTATVQDIPIPAPLPHEILVRVHYVALNPVDALYTFNPLGASGRVVGSDFAGVVEAVGTSVPSDIKTGTRVAGFLQGACSVNDLQGAFAEYLTVPFDLAWRVPHEISLAQAASVSLCGLTAAQGLFYRLGIAAPFDWDDDHALSSSSSDEVDPVTVFIYGASTSVGLYAAQLVNLAFASSSRRLSLIGTASASRHAQLKAKPYSYDHLVDYRGTDWPQQIRELCGENGGVDYALDCISEGLSVERVSRTLAGGSRSRLAVFRSREGGAWNSDNMPVEVEPVYGAVWEGLGKEVEYQGMFLPVSPRARDFAVSFYRFLSSKLELEPNPVRLMPGGLGKIVEDGFALLGPGSMDQRGSDARRQPWMKPISMEKLVYEILLLSKAD